MAKITMRLTDKNFRITIPYDVRLAENLKLGDIVEIDIIKYCGLRNKIDNIEKEIQDIKLNKILKKEE